MIERFYVNNYRCFENFAIDFSGHPSVLLIGKNGTGKSTILKALRILQKLCRGFSRVNELVAVSDFSHNRTSIPIRFEVELKIDARRLKYNLVLEFSSDAHEVQVAGEALETDGDVVFSRDHRDVTQPGSTSFALDQRIVALPVIGIRDRVIDTLREQVRYYLASMVLIAPVPSVMWGYSTVETSELDENAANLLNWLSSLLLRSPAAYSVIESYLRFAMPDLAYFENKVLGEKTKWLMVTFANGATGTPSGIPFFQLSDGEKCFFLSALIVAANRMMGPLFCFWDEPDNHLSLPEVGHFITQLRKMTNQNGGQFIATSHHPEAIRRFSDDTTLVLSRKSHLEPTVVRPLADFKYSGDLIAALIRDEVIG